MKIQDILSRLNLYRTHQSDACESKIQLLHEEPRINRSPTVFLSWDTLSESDYLGIAKQIKSNLIDLEKHPNKSKINLKFSSGIEVTVELDRARIMDSSDDLLTTLKYILDCNANIAHYENQEQRGFYPAQPWHQLIEETKSKRQLKLGSLKEIIRNFIPHLPDTEIAAVVSQPETASLSARREFSKQEFEPYCVLHLSDLHFKKAEEAALWHTQLRIDLRQALKFNKLKAVVISGDITDRSLPIEYGYARSFLEKLMATFSLSPQQLILVPGNHDVDWAQGARAYETASSDGNNIGAGSTLNESLYLRRFEPFAKFFEALQQKPYPLEYGKQVIVHCYAEQNLLVLGFNSAWNTDQTYPDRAGINIDAWDYAVSLIENLPNHESYTKVAVWHHPLGQFTTAAGLDGSIAEQLTLLGFRLILHGHVHRAENQEYRYYQTKSSSNVQIACAGTFGAPSKQLRDGYPFQYQVLEFTRNEIIVHTRKREEASGAWKPDSRWESPGSDPLPRYEIPLK